MLKINPGISLLIVVLVISAMALLIATTAGFIGIDALQTSMRQSTTLQAFVGADGCMEIAIKKLRDDRNYSGETITLGDNTCVITVTGSGTARMIKASAAYVSSAYLREIQVDVDWRTTYQVTSWQELMN